jgi:hypothetical protein
MSSEDLGPGAEVAALDLAKVVEEAHAARPRAGCRDPDCRGLDCGTMTCGMILRPDSVDASAPVDDPMVEDFADLAIALWERSEGLASTTARIRLLATALREVFEIGQMNPRTPHPKNEGETR